jgi:hypothetical protein
MAILSEVDIRNANQTMARNPAEAPIIVNFIETLDIASRASSGFVRPVLIVSATSPNKKTNEGKPSPQIIAHMNANKSKALSLLSANVRIRVRSETYS